MSCDAFLEYLGLSLLDDFGESRVPPNQSALSDEVESVSVEILKVDWIGSVCATKVEVPF